ncbi:hypothetical protein MMC26_006201 [Xylographa opegraphella]|nr:hypothetical protein [Xylographa opegraphella]
MAGVRDKPGFRDTKKAKARDTQMIHSQNNHHGPSAELQQSLLNIFKGSLTERFNASLAPSIQTVKRHLYNREFSKAFGSEHLLEAYAVRWSPCRALAYMHLICGLPKLASLLSGAPHNHSTNDRTRVLYGNTSSLGRQASLCGETVAHPATWTEEDTTSKGRIVTCLGGGAGAEMMALAGCWHYLAAFSGGGVAPAESNEPTRQASAVLTVRVIDMANWASVVEKLYQGTTAVPSVSECASSSTPTSRTPLLYSEYFKLAFDQRDILNLEVESLAMALQNSSLVTLTFTLNELYNTSMSKTTKFLLTLTYLMEPGMLFLVVDSPGSYSTVKLNGTSRDTKDGAEKKYPMKWLLDHTLLEASSISSSKNTAQQPQWEKLASSDSTWFRLQDGLKYPLKLEDMRYQYHLYKRI